MRFDWDSAKSEANLARRRFDFAFSARIFAGHIIGVEDTRRDYGEVRIRAIGRTAGRMLVVVYTDRNDVRCIISARYANRKERVQWLKMYG